MDIADPEVTQHKAAPNTRIGSDRYRIRSTLGAGGMGVVYLADDLKLHRQVAIKKLKDDAASQNARDRIQQEARLLAQLNHPNIVALHDVLEDNGSVALVMEYIEGTTLRAWMRERSPSLQQKLSLLMQICLGLSEAHSLGIIHRDLKSDNILIAENTKGEPVAKITDFGIAKSQQLDEKTLTAENQLAGTITAMSPEQILGKPLDARSDLFSLGTIAYELLTGSRPFGKNDIGALAMANRVTNDPHTPPETAWPDIPEPLAILLDKLLSKDTKQRPQSASDVYEVLAYLIEQTLTSNSFDLSKTATLLITRPKKNQWIKLGTAIAIVALCYAGYWAINREQQPIFVATLPIKMQAADNLPEKEKEHALSFISESSNSAILNLKHTYLIRNSTESSSEIVIPTNTTDIIQPEAICDLTKCEITFSRINSKNNSIIATTKASMLSAKLYDSNSSIQLAINELFNDRHLSATPNISSDEFKRYFEISESINSGKINSENLQLLESLIYQNPDFPNGYLLFIRTAEQLFNRSNDESIHKKIEALLTHLNTSTIQKNRRLQIEAQAHIALGNGEKAEKIISTLRELGYSQPEMYTLAAKMELSKGNNSKANDYIDMAIELFPTRRNYYLKSYINYSIGNHHEAKKNIEKFLELSPDHKSGLGLLAAIDLQTGNLNNSIKSLLKISDEDRSAPNKVNLGFAYMLQKKYMHAMKQFESALALQPENLGTKINLADSLKALGMLNKANQTYESIKNSDNTSQNWKTQLFKAVAESNLGQTREATRRLHSIRKEAENDYLYRYNAAIVYLASGDTNMAEIYIEALLNEDKISPVLLRYPGFESICQSSSLNKAQIELICN
ncbi:serine/threonine-protein kinase [Microbulbifer sp. Q7]|uniref:serine/threonine-protein kinase n=1 Tax=Microbulbifer sp. Q7 TaxID=1785091 RepID=UPI00082FFBD5|nr:serine/threonine-protein kinase [Microbulbifer sp. Q7]